MYPNLSYIFHDLFGTEPDNWASVFQTFGLFMALAFLSAALNLFSELRRKQKQGLMLPVKETIAIGKPASPIEILWNAFIGFLIGFKVLYIFQNFPEFQADAPGVLMSSKGSMLGGIVMAIILGGLKYWEKNSDKLDKPREQAVNIFPSDRTGDITVVAAITGLLGAKIFALIETPAQFFADPIGQLFSGSGLAIYGGLIGGTIGVISYIAWKKISVAHFADAVAPGLMLSYGVGRIGCQLSGDGDWGIPNANPTPEWWFLPDWMWSYGYPRNVSNEGVRMEDCPWEHCSEMIPGVYPTPLYEVVMSLIIFSILWSLRKRLKIPGMLFFIYMILNGVERFWIEKIRVNYKLPWADITQAELIAMLLMIGGVIGIIVVWMRSKSKTVAT